MTNSQSFLENQTVQPDTIVLQAKGLAKSFGGVRAVDGMDLSVRQGGITGLIGPNGAGKSTLFNLMTGVIRPDAGSVTLFGQDVTGQPSHKLAEKGLIRTFQLSREMGRLTVLENMMMAPLQQRGEFLIPLFFNRSKVAEQDQQIYERAQEILEFSHLASLADEYAENLSGGQKKLLELARALMLNCDLILLDEPGAGVNPALMGTLTEMIVTLNETYQKTFLIIEHDMDLIGRLCDPVIVMTQGSHLVEGHFDDIRKDPRVIEAYLGGASEDTDD